MAQNRSRIKLLSKRVDFENRQVLFSAAFLPVLFFVLIFFIPVFTVSISGFSSFGKILSDTYYFRVIGFTLLQALLSAFFAVLAGIPAAVFFYKYKFRGKSVFRAAASVPFIIPPVIAVLGFVTFFGNNGFLNSLLMKMFQLTEPPLKILYSFKAIIIVHVFYNLPVSMKILLDRFENFPLRQYYASQSLGAGRSRTFFNIVLPFFLPSLISAFSIIFLYCFLSFAVIYVLSGGPAFSVIEIEVFNFIKNDIDYSAAAALSLCGLILSLSITGILYLVRRKSDYPVTENSIHVPVSASVLFRKPLKLIFYVFYLLTYLLVSVAPIFSVFVKAFTAKTGGFTFAWFKSLAETSAGSAVLNTLLIGICAAALTGLLSLCYSFYALRNGKARQLIGGLFLLPVAVSPFLVAGGYLLLQSRGYFPPGINPLIFLIAVHTAAAMPLSFKFISNGLLSYNRNLSYASYSMGESPFRTFFRVELPYIFPALISQSIFAFAVSAGELSAAIIFSGNFSATVPVKISRLLSAYRIESACALGSILIFLCFCVFLVLELLNKRRNGKLL